VRILSEHEKEDNGSKRPPNIRRSERHIKIGLNLIFGPKY
jgi:hypothetical protein